jgi:DNA polymerase III subunit alpha
MEQRAMTERRFVHLHCHSHYSLLDGANRIPELVERTKALGMNAIALTDHGNLYGAIEFYRECTGAGINPIIGYEAYVAPAKLTDREASRRKEAGFHLTLLAKNETGFRNLIKMSSVAFLQGYYYVPRIDKDLLAAHHEGIICLSGCASAEFSEFILKDQLDEATRLASWFHKLFGNDFYIEIQNNGLDLQKRCAEGAIDIAQKMGLPLVATCDAHYLCQADAGAHDVLLCINTGRLRSDESRMRYGSDQFYVRSPDEMHSLFPGHEDAVQRSQEIADDCSLKLDFTRRHFPVFTPPHNKKPEDYLRELCEIGLKERYGEPSPQAARDRLEHELGIICRMGFASYFLIVWDFVRFARERKIPASARGSAVGSLVSYVLKFSHVCPLEHDLLFERFLDPNRNEAPDIDIDFCQEGREEVIAYVRQRYGEQSVAQIGTFGTLAARAAVKDVGRVLDIPLERVTRLTNMIPKVLNITLEKALEQSPELRHEYENDPAIHELLDIAKKLEGTNRNAGTHAAGVVIANGPLTDYVPLQRVVRKNMSEVRSPVSDVQKQETRKLPDIEQRTSNNVRRTPDTGHRTPDTGHRTPDTGHYAMTTQWEMGDIAKVGLLKMDFLGLRTLTLLDNCVRMIEQNRGEKIDLFRLPLNDAKTFALLQSGEARGIFQLESEGIRELLKRMKPDSLRDLIAIMALYRPGPLQGGMVDDYVNRKHGRAKPTYPHPVMEEILAETYGVMTYQEQIMRILNRLGGIELSKAYSCIKAISKKTLDVIEKHSAEFLQGAKERGLSGDKAIEIFELITHFAGYGFNKSHTAAYAQIGYQTAYLKANYSAEFMAALLSSEIEDGNKRDIMVEHFEDAKRLGCPVEPPNVNQDEPDFTVRDGRILFGLVAIKGVGRAAAQEISRARGKAPFKDLFDFSERVDLKAVPKAAVERLVKAGAFDCLGAHRAQLWQVLPRAIQAAGEMQEDKRHGQMNLFEEFAAQGTNGPAVADSLPDVPEWPAAEKLKYEKEALDFYISSHPLAQHEEVIRLFSTHTTLQLRELNAGHEVMVGGMLSSVRFGNTKNARNGNSRYSRFKLEDFTGSVECVMWPDDFARQKDLVVEDQICFAAASVERSREEPGLVVQRLLTMEQAQQARTTGVVINFRVGKHARQDVEAVARILQRSQGQCPVFLNVIDNANRRMMLKTSEEFRVNPKTLARADLETLLGSGSVFFSRQGNGSGRNGK